MTQSTLLSELPAMRVLENEHRYLSYLMEQWHSIARNLQNCVYTSAQAKEEMARLRMLLSEFKIPLKKHMEKEEAIFFPLLGQYIGYEQGPIMSIEQEHEEVFAYIDHFLHHSEGDYTPLEMSAISRDACEAFEILTIHFVKEETVLFSLAAQTLSKPDRNKLYEELHTLIVD
ncbi:hemerythrin domain-containing protein [Paenibacillus sp. A14]|uniref:hemerythrin domain-containing protein n=1 Tax=Paenibacillus sp. A14 TaxID=3119820 RepID=UPI002FE18A43